MEWWKILALVIACVYIIGATLHFSGDNSDTHTSPKDLFEGAVGMFFWLLISLSCIWYGDELGDGLIGARFGLISETSPGWAVAFMVGFFFYSPAYFSLSSS